MIIDTLKQLDAFLQLLEKQEEYVVDTETSGFEVWGEDRLCGIGFCLPDESTYYLPFRHKPFDDHLPMLVLFEPEAAEMNLPLECLPKLWTAMRKPKRIIGHNIKFDLAVLSRDGFEVADHQEIEETLCGSRIWFPDAHPDMSLEGITKALLDKDEFEWKKEFKAYLKKRKIEKHYDRAEIPVIAEYCESDCKNTWLSRNKLVEYAKETDQWGVYTQEISVLKIIWNMERNGLNLDQQYLIENVPYLQEVLMDLQDQLQAITGEEFNPWSNPQLTRIFGLQGIKPKAFTEKGGPSWTDEVLQKVDTKLSALILQWRAIDKLLSTYFIPYSEIPGAIVHCNFKSWGAVTGRFSCANPNLQQLAKPEEWAISGWPDFNVQVRQMFIPPPGFDMYFADYSQMEMLVYADYLDDEALRAKLATGTVDFHDMVTMMVFGVDHSHPEWKDFRFYCKKISLGLIYGMGIEKLAKSINKSEDEARVFRAKYFMEFPKAPTFIANVKKKIVDRGYVFNRFGRRYYMEPEKSYAAINYLVQGTSADIIKRAMIRLDATFKQFNAKSRLCVQVHDEFVFYIHRDEASWILPMVKRDMEHQEIKTFLPIDISKGNPDWAHKIKICKNCFETKGDEHQC